MCISYQTLNCHVSLLTGTLTRQCILYSRLSDWGNQQLQPCLVPEAAHLLTGLDSQGAASHLVPFSCFIGLFALAVGPLVGSHALFKTGLPGMMTVSSLPVDYSLECLAIAPGTLYQTSAKVTQKSCSGSRGGAIPPRPFSESLQIIPICF